MSDTASTSTPTPKSEGVRKITDTKDGWLKALQRFCPACGAEPHTPCRNILAPHNRKAYHDVHWSRINAPRFTP